MGFARAFVADSYLWIPLAEVPLWRLRRARALNRKLRTLPRIGNLRLESLSKRDKANPPKPGTIVFAGSSSFVRWNTLVDDMKPLEVINRGFGGSQMSDLDYYAKRIVNVYRPKAVLVYEGDNDLAASSPKTPEMVADGYPAVRPRSSAKTCRTHGSTSFRSNLPSCDGTSGQK